MKTRIEKDPLGEKAVPADALYGIQTLRAVENFPISGLRPLPAFVDAVIWIKRSAALTHRETGRLEPALADAIVRAADEILAGQHRDQFVVDVYQAGAGTSHNMNCNEVLANRANELLGAERGVYAPVHPNDHVNMAQSTNDVIPTAMRLAMLATIPRLFEAMDRLATAFLEKGHAFDDIVKSGRTHLQDATPIRLGQEFSAYGRTITRHRSKLARATDWLRDMNIGGTAVGTGLNAEAAYPALMVRHLQAGERAGATPAGRPHPAHAVDGRHRHLQRRSPGLRARPQQDRQRYPASRLGSPHRPGRDRPAGRSSPAPASCPAR